MLFLLSFENFRVFDSNQLFPMLADTLTRRKSTCLISNTRFSVVPLIHLQTCFVDPNGSGKTTLTIAQASFLEILVQYRFLRRERQCQKEQFENLED